METSTIQMRGRRGRKRAANGQNVDERKTQSEQIDASNSNLIPFTSDIIANHIFNLQKLHPNLFKQIFGESVENPSQPHATNNQNFELSSAHLRKPHESDWKCTAPERKNAKESTGSIIKDAKYYERRLKNNLAAKKSRDARKLREDQIALRVSQLEQENAILRCQVAMLEKESGALQIYLIQRQQLQSSNSLSLADLTQCSSLISPSIDLSPRTTTTDNKQAFLQHHFQTLPSFQFFAPNSI